MSREATGAAIFFYSNEVLVGGCEVPLNGKPTQLMDRIRINFYGDIELINGLEYARKGSMPHQANGIRCLGAQVITHLKGYSETMGGVYLTNQFPEQVDDWLPWTYVFRQVATPQEAFMGLPGVLEFEVYARDRFVYGGSFKDCDFAALEQKALAA